MDEIYQIKYLGHLVDIFIGKEEDGYFYHLTFEGDLFTSDNEFTFDTKFDAVSAAIKEICDGDSALETQLKRDIKISEIVE